MLEYSLDFKVLLYFNRIIWAQLNTISKVQFDINVIFNGLLIPIFIFVIKFLHIFWLELLHSMDISFIENSNQKESLINLIYFSWSIILIHFQLAILLFCFSFFSKDHHKTSSCLLEFMNSHLLLVDLTTLLNFMISYF